jgi:hypothetical protein
LLGFAAQCGNAAEHTLIPQPGTVQIFNFDAATPPVLRIESGDIVNIETAGSLDPADIDRTGAVPYGAVPEHIRSLFRLVKERGPHFLPRIVWNAVWLVFAKIGSKEMIGSRWPSSRLPPKSKCL